MIGAGRLEEASDICHRLIDESANSEAVYLLAIITGQSGMYAESLTLFEKAVSDLPGRADVTYNFGVILNGMGKPDEALQWWHKTLEINENHADALYNLGRIYIDRNLWDDARGYFSKLADLDPDNPRVLLNLGNVDFRLRHFDQARTHFRKIVDTDRSHIEAWTNLGLTEHRDGNPEAAIACFSTALEQDPENVLPHVNLAQALLLTGNLKEGYAENEWRRKIQELRFSVDGQKPWSGDDPAGRRILLYAEQGQGIPSISSATPPSPPTGAPMLGVYCHPSLTGIAKTVAGVETATGFGEPPPPFDAYAPLMSLPHLLDLTDLDTIPPAPYVSADGTPPRLGKEGAIRVGLVWAGNPDHDDDANRSCPLEIMAPLFEVKNTDFYSLQVDQPAGDIETLGFSGRISDLGQSFTDFQDTAKAILTLDLVISVDTAVAHLAGALGKPVWLMIPKVPDWRWFQEGPDTPWYSTMRLFRKHKDGTWPPVVAEIRDALIDLAGPI